MRKLPEEICEIASALEERKLNGWTFDWVHSRESTTQLLSQLADANNPCSIPCAARFLFSSNDRVHEAAVSVVGQLISKVPPYELTSLSVELSSVYGWAIYEYWRQVQATDVERLAGNAERDGYSGVLGLLSFHCNGFVRHEAIRRLCEINDGSELSFLIFRQNDWVEPIALQAQQAVNQRVNEDNIHQLVRCLRLILHTDLMRRFDGSDLLRRVFDLLCQPKYDNLLRSTIFSSDRKLSHGIVKYIFQFQGEHQLRVIDFAMESTDSIVRDLCCKQLGKLGNANRFMAVQDRLLHDRFMPVRREALEQKAKYLPEQAEDIWKEALYDSSRSIRELARFMLKELGILATDIAEVYRRKLKKQPELFAALQGLTEVGDVSDSDIFRSYLFHRWPSRRAAAIDGLARVQKDAAINELLPHLREESPCVVRAVRRAIGCEAYLIDGMELQLVAFEASSFFSKKIAIDLIFSLGKWKSISLLLSIAASLDAKTAKYAEQTLMRWFQPPECVKVFTRASEQDKADINDEISKYGSKISETLLKLVQREIAMF